MKRKHPTIAGQPVTMGRLREFVIARDGRCLGSIHTLTHLCRDRYGEWDRSKMVDLDSLYSLEHVTRVHGNEDGRHDDERHTVTLCYWLNGSGPSLAPPGLRDFMRAYLLERYPECEQ